MPTRRLPRRWLSGDPGVDPARTQPAFDRQHAANEFSTRVHLVFACLALFLAAGPTSPGEIGWAALGVCALLRLNYSWRTYASLFAQPTVWVLMLFAAWLFAGIAWSDDKREAIEQAGALRFALIPLGLWPVMNRRGLLIGAYAAGWVAGWGAQLAQEIGLVDFARDAGPGRISGWWDPAIAGTLLMVPLGLHLAGLVLGAGKWKLAAGAGLACTVVAIIATGTRGAWLCAAALTSATMLVWFVRSGATKRTKLLALASVVLVAAVAGFALRANIAARYDEARDALTRITENRDYETSTGRRVLMYRVAADAFAEAPLQGQGVGDFRAYWDDWNQRQGREGLTLAHAHCAPMQLAATSGLVGLTLGTLSFVVVAIGAVRCARTLRTPSGYHAGPALALAGLLLISAFDSVQVNAQSAMQLGVLAALCPWWLPAQRALNEPRP